MRINLKNIHDYLAESVGLMSKSEYSERYNGIFRIWSHEVNNSYVD